MAQKKVAASDVHNFVGDTVMVCGKIYGGRFLDYGNRKPTLLNMGAKFPKQDLTVIIYGDNRMKFGYKPEDMLNEKEICVTGRVELYNNKPQLVVTDPFQIKIMQ